MFWKKLDIAVAHSNMQYLMLCPFANEPARKANLGVLPWGLETLKESPLCPHNPAVAVWKLKTSAM